MNRTSFLSFCRSIIPPGFLSCKGMAVLADTKHHVAIGEESFPAAFRNHRLRFSGKDSLPIVWLSAIFDCHAFLARKKAWCEGYAGMLKKNSDLSSKLQGFEKGWLFQEIQNILSLI